MDLDLINKEEIEDPIDGFRNIIEDKEMQAYASVLYLLGMMSSVIPDIHVQILRSYILQKFPILDKIRYTNNYSKICRKEKKEEIEKIAELWRTLLSNDMPDYKAKNIVAEEISKMRPEHEEDLLVENILFDDKAHNLDIEFYTNVTETEDSNTDLVNVVPLTSDKFFTYDAVNVKSIIDSLKSLTMLPE